MITQESWQGMRLAARFGEVQEVVRIANHARLVGLWATATVLCEDGWEDTYPGAKDLLAAMLCLSDPNPEARPSEHDWYREVEQLNIAHPKMTYLMALHLTELLSSAELDRRRAWAAYFGRAQAQEVALYRA